MGDTATIYQTFIQSTKHTAYDFPKDHFGGGGGGGSVPLLSQRLDKDQLMCPRRVQWVKGVTEECVWLLLL